MVDRTLEFKGFLIDDELTATMSRHSLFVMNSGLMLSSINNTYALSVSAYSNYIGYHKHIRKYKETIMSDGDRSAFDQNIAIFIASYATRIHDLASKESNNEHHKEITVFLLNVQR